MKVERAALIALLLANAIVLFPFWKNILWASIIAITVWPVNIKLRNFLKNKSVSALALTVGLALIAFSLVVPALIKMYLEGIDLAERIKQINISNVITDLPERINFWGITLNIPYDRLQDLTAFISSKIFPVIIHTLSTAVTTAGSAIVTMMLLFFVLRDGEKIP
ncbi:MAG: AI-2E family transporter, partial [Deltaproteobacteria bacterium]|nr:AI-2E family transporter [Deltaproteobacteria bacterium]